MLGQIKNNTNFTGLKLTHSAQETIKTLAERHKTEVAKGLNLLDKTSGQDIIELAASRLSKNDGIPNSGITYRLGFANKKLNNIGEYYLDDLKAYKRSEIKKCFNSLNKALKKEQKTNFADKILAKFLK